MRTPLADLSVYELQHLMSHCEASGQFSALHKILTLETSDRQNAWYEAKVSTSDVHGYLEDVERAWRLSGNTHTDNSQPAFSLALHFRYSLTLASLNVVSLGAPTALIVALTQKDIWTPAQALAYAGRIPMSDKRFEALHALLP